MSTPSQDYTAAERDLAHGLAGMWWLWLVLGIGWLGAAFVILQFDQASIKTIGYIIGIMFVVVGLETLLLAALAERHGWVWGIFGVLFLIAGVVAFINPEETFHGLADVLGFLFFIVGVWWLIRAFIEREVNPLWWLGLISGILMLILAFWTSGQFFIEKAYTLLIFAGIWALMTGLTDIVKAFQVRSLRNV